MIKNMGFCYFYILVLCTFLNACATKSQHALEINRKKNIEYNAILTDPVIKKDFRNLKIIAANASINSDNDNPRFNENTLQQLDQATAVLVDRLQNHYHLNANNYKIHVYLGKNKPDSCYQYYHSYHKQLIGKSCGTTSSTSDACKACHEYTNIVKSRSMKIVHASWLTHKETTALVDTFKLRNGDAVFLGLDLSPTN